jgi:hypothetical protein
MSDDITPQDIASELVYHTLMGKADDQDYAFEYKGKKAIVRIEILDESVQAPDRVYIALNPPGTKCACCKGTGVQKRPEAGVGALYG